jgi:SAM-dependent methyltransferase
MVSRYHVVAENGHEIQNPTSEGKLLLLGERLGLGAGSRVLDIASGRGGPALVLAGAYGCTIDGIEVRPEFQEVAVARVTEQELSHLVSFRLADARKVELAQDIYDAALCLGASFVYGGLADTVATLASAVRPGGYVAVGEPYWRTLPLPEDYDDRNELFTSLEGTVTVFETEGLPVVSVIASSEDDWDRYETLHWRSVEEWLVANPKDPDAAELRGRHERYKRTYLRFGRELLGWAIFVGWKRP